MGFIGFEKEKKMDINYEYDQDGCIDVELIENSVDWHKEKNGDNILLQYINGGESMRIVERFAEDVNIAEAHHHAKSLMVKFSDGNVRGYHQDQFGNYRLLSEFRKKEYENTENRQNKSDAVKYVNSEKLSIGTMIAAMKQRTY